MPGPQRAWNAVPTDTAIGPQMQEFLTWLMSVAKQTQASLFQPQPPTVTTISHPSAVQVLWNEVPNASQYAVFENSTNAVPPGVPFATVPANLGANSNSILRPNLNDTTTRYYFVQAIDRNGNRSQISTGTAGAALSGGSTVIPVSQTPVNQGGVGGGVGGGGAIFGKQTLINRTQQ